MTTDSNSLLGATEQLVAKQLREAIETSLKSSSDLMEELQKIDLDSIAPSLLDSEKRDMVVGTVEMMQGLSKQLATAQLISILTRISINPKESKEA